MSNRKAHDEIMAARSRLANLRNRFLPLLAVGLFALLVLWVLLAPAEARLGDLVKLVYLHGALIQVGLALFTLAGGLGLVALLVRRPVWYRGTQAAGTAALVVWILYVISSMAVTGLPWERHRFASTVRALPAGSPKRPTTATDSGANRCSRC